ncbi:MAG TPA: hypothetical protein VG735_03160 [Caulobacterales bacterium]|nr:hypothetical protein [Caulobacterales bacterium]
MTGLGEGAPARHRTGNVMPEEVDGHIEETPLEARGGVNVGWQTRILVISTVGAACALIAYFFFYANPG